jgi:predicted metal-dependent phosphoesterase TrpH
MKVELHLHTNRHSECAVATPAECMERLVQTGYGAVYITEHDAIWSEWEIAQLQAGYPNLRIFPGVELTLSADPIQHLVVLGTTDAAYLLLDDPADILAKARAEGHLTILAHPFRWSGAARLLERGLRPDALEGRTSNHNVNEAALAEAEAEKLELRLVHAGDAHGLHSIGRFWIETDRALKRAGDIRAAVLNGRYVNCMGEGES